MQGKLFKVSLVAAVLLGALGENVRAVPSDVSISGSFTYNATQSGFLTLAAIDVGPATGAFAGASGSPVSASVFDFNPYAGLGSFSFTSGGQAFTLTLNSIDFMMSLTPMMGSVQGLLLSGVATLSGPGLVTTSMPPAGFDQNFFLTIDNSGAATTFSASFYFDNVQQDVPDLGSTLGLLIVGLVALTAARRVLVRA